MKSFIFEWNDNVSLGMVQSLSQLSCIWPFELHLDTWAASSHIAHLPGRHNQENTHWDNQTRGIQAFMQTVCNVKALHLASLVSVYLCGIEILFPSPLCHCCTEKCRSIIAHKSSNHFGKKLEFNHRKVRKLRALWRVVCCKIYRNRMLLTII